MIEAILFDFDGVLTTDATGSLTTTRYLSRATGVDPGRMRAAFDRYNRDLTLGRTTHAAIWVDLCRDLGRALDFRLLDEAFASTPMDARMLSLARALKRSRAVGIVTDNKQDRIDRLKALHRLPDLFDPIVVSAEFGAGKEEPGIFLEASRRLGVDPRACAFVDNRRENLLAPRSLGMTAIHYDDAKRDVGALLAALRACGALDVDA